MPLLRSGASRRRVRRLAGVTPARLARLEATIDQQGFHRKRNQLPGAI
jgi:hypothetical protein